MKHKKQQYKRPDPVPHLIVSMGGFTISAPVKQDFNNPCGIKNMRDNNGFLYAMPGGYCINELFQFVKPVPAAQ